MKDEYPAFGGFNKNVFKFLNDLTKNNNVEWFTKNRDRYQSELVQPARSFVIEMQDFFNRLNPAIRTEPKFNETLMRINKDMRFSKGEPYRNYFLIHFGKFKMDSEFYVYFDPDGFSYGLFINNGKDDKNFYFKRNLVKYSEEFLTLLVKYNLNNKFELHELNKESKLLEKKFDGDKHLEICKDLKMILIQKSLKITDKKIFSPGFIIEAIKTFSMLYPIYCFSISPQPLKLIEEFEEQFGNVI
ncbi:MAG: DUF2461 family protein [Ignavibacteriales bacterium]|nr:DUF2461 family protein [Ignavibacteriales bacterium]